MVSLAASSADAFTFASAASTAAFCSSMKPARDKKYKKTGPGAGYFIFFRVGIFYPVEMVDMTILNYIFFYHNYKHTSSSTCVPLESPYLDRTVTLCSRVRAKKSSGSFPSSLDLLANMGLSKRRIRCQNLEFHKVRQIYPLNLGQVREGLLLPWV